MCGCTEHSCLWAHSSLTIMGNSRRNVAHVATYHCLHSELRKKCLFFYTFGKSRGNRIICFSFQPAWFVKLNSDHSRRRWEQLWGYMRCSLRGMLQLKRVEEQRVSFSPLCSGVRWLTDSPQHCSAEVQTLSRGMLKKEPAENVTKSKVDVYWWRLARLVLLSHVNDVLMSDWFYLM